MFIKVDCCRSPHRSHTIYPADVVLIEGILVFYFPEVRELFHMKLFVDTDSDTRLARRGNMRNTRYHTMEKFELSVDDLGTG